MAMLVMCVVVGVLTNRANCELGTPVYVASWGSTTNNGSTPQSPVNSLQLAVLLSNNVIVLTGLSGSAQCLQTMPAEYEQLRIGSSAAGSTAAPVIELVYCTGPFLAVNQGPFEIELQSVVLECDTMIGSPMINLTGDQVVLRAEDVQFTSAQSSNALPYMRGWLSVGAGSSAHLNNCTFVGNGFNMFPLIQTMGSGQLFVTGTSFSGNFNSGGPCMNLPDFYGCVPEVVIFEGGSVVFDGCPADSSFQYFVAAANTTAHFIDSDDLFFVVVSLGNITTTLGVHRIEQFKLNNATLIVVPSPRNSSLTNLPALAMGFSTVYLPDVEGMRCSQFSVGSSVVYGSGQLLSVEVLSAVWGNSNYFYDCPISAYYAYFEASSFDLSVTIFEGVKGPSGADLVAWQGHLNYGAKLHGSLITEQLYLAVPTVIPHTNIAAPAYVESFSGWPNSTITVYLSASGRKEQKFTIPVLTVGSSKQPRSQLDFEPSSRELVVDKAEWSKATNSITLKLQTTFTPRKSNSGNLVEAIVAIVVISMLVVIGFSIWGCVVCCKRCGSQSQQASPTYLAVPSQTGGMAVYESL